MDDAAQRHLELLDRTTRDEVTRKRLEKHAFDGRVVAVVTGQRRVLDVTALAPTIAAARDRAYAAIDAIDWPEGFCRRDIGWRALARKKP